MLQRRLKPLLLLAVIMTLVISTAVLAADGSPADPVTTDIGGPPQSMQPAEWYEAIGTDAAAQPTAVGAVTSFHTKRIPSVAFQGFGTTVTQNGGGAVRVTSGTGALFAPVELPASAEITGITLYYWDTAASDGVLALIKESGDSSLETALASATSTGTAGWGSAGASLPTPEPATAFHYLRFTQTANVDVWVAGALVSYRIPSNYSNLVFTPVTPCVAFDSRVSQGGTGAFSAEEARNVRVLGTGLDGQGGEAGGCGLPAATGGLFASKAVKAVHINVVAIGPAGGGQVKAWPADEPEPASGALVNYIPGGNNSNAFNVAIGQCVFLSGCAPDLKIKAKNSSSDIRVVVTGYYTLDPNQSG